MLSYALKMLIGDKAKYIGLILGLSFAAFIISQQAGIFVGLLARTYSYLTDTPQPDIWVIDPQVQFIDDIKPLRDTDLNRVYGIEGVEWAVPMFKGLLRARSFKGTFQTCNVIGLDDASLIGGPPEIVQGSIEDLRMDGAIIVDEIGANDKLAYKKNGIITPLQVGETIEINDQRAYVVGICRVARTFQSQPVIYTTYTRALSYAPYEVKLLSFIAAKARQNVDPKVLCQKIHALTGLNALTTDQFKELTINYYMTYTGIPINFGVAVLLGFIIGTAIAGQTFYNFTLDNLRYFATLKAMGADMPLLTRMVLLQAGWVCAIGWGFGLGGACLFGFLTRNTLLAFLMPWQLFLITAITMAVICAIAALISIRQLRKFDPAIVFKS